MKPMPVTTTPLTSSIGAVVDDVQLRDIGDAEARALRATLAEHGVLVFPRQELTREQQVDATRVVRCRARTSRP